MATLLDIATVSELVLVPGPGGKKQDLEVFGVSAEGIAMLFNRFPEIRALITGKTLERDKLAKLAAPAIAAVIAASCGTPGDKKAELAASRLPLSAQMDVLEATVKLTMPDGMGPFVERLTALAGMLNAQAETVNPSDMITVPATKSPSPSSS